VTSESAEKTIRLSAIPFSLLETLALDADIGPLGRIVIGGGICDGGNISNLGGEIESLCYYNISIHPRRRKGCFP